MVVFGHFIENFQDIWNSGYTRVAWQFIYLFHMPGFAFISGYFSKKKDTRIFEKVLEKQIIRVCQEKCVNGYISCQQIGTRLSNSIAN